MKIKEYLMMKHFQNGSKNKENNKYRAEYEHPLVVGNVKRKAKTLGIEIKMATDWE